MKGGKIKRRIKHRGSRTNRSASQIITGATHFYYESPEIQFKSCEQEELAGIWHALIL